jgi:hypothetical protein
VLQLCNKLKPNLWYSSKEKKGYFWVSILGETCCFVVICIISINIICLRNNYISFLVTSFILLSIFVIVSAQLLVFLRVYSTSYESNLKLAKTLKWTRFMDGKII